MESEETTHVKPRVLLVPDSEARSSKNLWLLLSWWAPELGKKVGFCVAAANREKPWPPERVSEAGQELMPTSLSCLQPLRNRVGSLWTGGLMVVCGLHRLWGLFEWVPSPSSWAAQKWEPVLDLPLQLWWVQTGPASLRREEHLPHGGASSRDWVRPGTGNWYNFVLHFFFF